MRISDWSSDVCSSDLAGGARRRILRRDDHDEKAPIGETVGMKRVIADRGYDANRIRATLRAQGTIPVIPGHRNRTRPIQYDERRYKEDRKSTRLNSSH